MSKALSSEEGKIIVNVFNYFKTENLLLKRNALVEVTVKATGASATSVKRIVGEEDGNKPPGKSGPKRKKAFNRLDELDFGVIQHMMHSFYTRAKCPTLAKLHSKLREKINFPYSIVKIASSINITRFSV